MTERGARRGRSRRWHMPPTLRYNNIAKLRFDPAVQCCVPISLCDGTCVFCALGRRQWTVAGGANILSPSVIDARYGRPCGLRSPLLCVEPHDASVNNLFRRWMSPVTSDQNSYWILRTAFGRSAATLVVSATRWRLRLASRRRPPVGWKYWCRPSCSKANVVLLCTRNCMFQRGRTECCSALPEMLNPKFLNPRALSPKTLNPRSLTRKP
eukprot:1195042-Prorocentrum_minimum.AAC.5